MKKCELCHQKIDVHQGGYLNEYKEAWEMHTFHLECYTGQIIEKYKSKNLKSSRVTKHAPPSENSGIRTLDDLFLSPIHAPPPEQTCTTKHAPCVRCSL